MAPTTFNELVVVVVSAYNLKASCGAQKNGEPNKIPQQTQQRIEGGEISSTHLAPLQIFIVTHSFAYLLDDWLAGYLIPFKHLLILFG